MTENDFKEGDIVELTVRGKILQKSNAHGTTYKVELLKNPGYIDPRTIWAEPDEIKKINPITLAESGEIWKDADGDYYLKQGDGYWYMFGEEDGYNDAYLTNFSAVKFTNADGTPV